MIHLIHPLSLLLFRHANVSLVGDVIKCLLEEVEVDALALLLADEEITLFEAGGDGGDGDWASVLLFLSLGHGFGGVDQGEFAALGHHCKYFLLLVCFDEDEVAYEVHAVRCCSNSQLLLLACSIFMLANDRAFASALFISAAFNSLLQLSPAQPRKAIEGTEAEVEKLASYHLAGEDPI